MARLLCVSLVAGHCVASSDDDLGVWRERVGKTRAGMLLADAKLLFPAYQPTETLRSGMNNLTLLKAQPYDGYDYELAGLASMTWGDHEVHGCWVTSDVSVWMDYDVMSAGNPLIRPVTVERGHPVSIRALFSEPDAFFVTPFTLRNTRPHEVAIASAGL